MPAQIHNFSNLSNESKEIVKSSVSRLDQKFIEFASISRLCTVYFYDEKNKRWKDSEHQGVLYQYLAIGRNPEERSLCLFLHNQKSRENFKKAINPGSKVQCQETKELLIWDKVCIHWSFKKDKAKFVENLVQFCQENEVDLVHNVEDEQEGSEVEEDEQCPSEEQEQDQDEEYFTQDVPLKQVGRSSSPVVKIPEEPAEDTMSDVNLIHLINEPRPKKQVEETQNTNSIADFLKSQVSKSNLTSSDFGNNFAPPQKQSSVEDLFSKINQKHFAKEPEPEKAGFFDSYSNMSNFRSNENTMSFGNYNTPEFRSPVTPQYNQSDNFIDQIKSAPMHQPQPSSERTNFMQMFKTPNSQSVQPSNFQSQNLVHNLSEMKRPNLLGNFQGNNGANVSDTSSQKSKSQDASTMT